MPPITILKSELVALEKKCKDQEKVIQDQQDLLNRVMRILADAGIYQATADEQKRSEV